MKPLALVLAGLALLPGCRQPEPPSELDGVEPWKAAMFCSVAMDRSARILVDLAWSSEDVVEQNELTREAGERRDMALQFGKRGIAIAEQEHIAEPLVRKALDDSEGLFDQQLRDAKPVEAYAEQLSERIRFCQETVLPALD